MARKKTIEVGSINVVLHPHSMDLYLELIEDARSRKIAGRINKNKRARFGPIETFKVDGKKIIYGIVFFYTSLNPNEPWLDDESDDEASDEQLKELKKQISKLHPEFKTMRFIFNPNNHKFYFQTKSEDGVRISPNSVELGLSAIFSDEHILEKFGEVETTVTPDKEALERVLSIPSLRKLVIDIKPPNPDDPSDAWAEVESELDSMNAKRMEVALTKSKGAETLIPDDRTVKLAQAAQENGMVRGEGYSEDGKKLSESTAKHPQIEIYELPPKESPIQSFKNFIASKLR